jgi:hypothetical protein
MTLLDDGLELVADPLAGDAELLADLLVRLSVQDVPDDRDLPFGQVLDRGVQSRLPSTRESSAAA